VKNSSDLWARRSGLAEADAEPPIEFDSTNYAQNRIPQHLLSNESEVDFKDNVSLDNPQTGVGVDGGNDDTLPQEDESDPAEEASQTEGAPQQEPNRTKSGRAIRRTQRLAESELLPVLRSFLSIANHVTNV
jgi:hypothetical protein